MKKYINNHILSGLLLLVIGAAMLMWPETATLVMVQAVGVLLLGGCVWQIIAFFRSPKEFSDVLLLVVTAVVTAAGILLVAKPSWAISYFFIVLGILIAVEGFAGILRAFALPRIGVFWIILLVVSIASLVLGAVVVWNPFSASVTLTRFAGVSFLVAAVISLIELFTGGKSRHGGEEEIIDEEPR